ncbi:hypothetical protein BC940DRAFT_363091 [Gongronella butleri]|nr:hypothetical protein BC940DRAFT_363091 [Gongronella butleri]
MSISRRQQLRLEKLARERQAKQEDPGSYVNQTPFRAVERYYKSRVPAPDYSKAIDPYEPNDQLMPVQLAHDLRDGCPFFGTAGQDTQKAYVLTTYPGLIVIPNPFSPAAQRHLIQQCLREYPKAPNVSNLHTHYHVPPAGLWPLFQDEANGTRPVDDPAYFVATKHADEDARDNVERKEQQNQQRTLAIPLKACDDAFNPGLTMVKADPAPSATVAAMNATQLLRRCRWVTLGYHYHWQTKTYHLDRAFPMPDLLSSVCASVVRSVQGVAGSNWRNTYDSSQYRAEAGVINYYQYRDTLMGHVDRSELNMDAPLVSISLGNACIFLIGGADRETEPSALYLRSGDIVVMTKPCRRSFHSVPRIIEDTLPEYLSASGTSDDAPDWRLFGEYMATTRININVRQVQPVHTRD